MKAILFSKRLQDQDYWKFKKNKKKFKVLGSDPPKIMSQIFAIKPFPL
jgi:hypothetical protein